MAEPVGIVLSPSAIKTFNKGKKRKVNPANWKQNSKKIARNAGKSYVSTSGKVVAEKTNSNRDRVCNPKGCFKEGCRILDKNKKEILFCEFYKNGYNLQSSFLASCIDIHEPARRRTATDATSRRKCTFRYFIHLEGKRTEICLKSLCDIFSITPRRVQVLQNKIKDGVVTPDDKRGTHTNRPWNTELLKNDIREHINSLPKQASHYSRHKSEKDYLSPELNLKKCYRMFKEKYPNNLATCRTYEDVFNSEFNLKFGAPRSDTCKRCDEFFIQLVAADSEEIRKRIEIESKIHHMRAEAAYNKLHSDCESATSNPKELIVLCVDLQQVIPCPALQHSSVYYQRQLSNYNLAIYNAGTNISTMNLWYECQAKRGSSEIASCIFKYIVSNYKLLAKGENRKLVVWSDRCVGQNNNWKMIFLYNYFILTGYFTQVEQKFLVSGHSFLPCDRHFALIEKKRRVINVILPADLKYLIAEAFVNKQFEIVELDQVDFLDFSGLEKIYVKRDESLKLTQVIWLKISADDPFAVFVRKSHNILQPWTRHSILRKSRGNQKRIQLPVPVQAFPQLYTQLLPLTAEKKKDLMDMTLYIGTEYREFYENLPSK